MTRLFPVWMMVGLCCLPVQGRSGVIRGTLHLPAPWVLSMAKRTTATRKSHAVAHPDLASRGALDNAGVYDGAFALPALPAGHYTICVWHPDLRGLRREVTVPEAGDVVLDLTL